jgi:hypothetical protein
VGNDACDRVVADKAAAVGWSGSVSVLSTVDVATDVKTRDDWLRTKERSGLMEMVTVAVASEAVFVASLMAEGKLTVMLPEADEARAETLLVDDQDMDAKI